MSRLIDIDELADYLKLKKQTIYNWLNQRKISGIKVGGVWRFDQKDIDNWLRSKKRETRGPVAPTNSPDTGES
jgi:excisionase family DNA binding protein